MCSTSCTATGSPPRARGRRADRPRQPGRRRFTPAGAGTAPAAGSGSARRPVHPRGRGDGRNERSGMERCSGSPPRARGRRPPGRRGVGGDRFTPAGAGTAWSSSRVTSPPPVHPRGRGDGRGITREQQHDPGSPPRARGRPVGRGDQKRVERFTPAGAGTAIWVAERTAATSVHPRGRGDGQRGADKSATLVGSPPRARGRRCGRHAGPRPRRFTPAGAGTAPTPRRRPGPRAVHPRGRGDGASPVGVCWRAVGSPPRARGRRDLLHRHRPPQRFTPAGAGTASTGSRSGGGTSVHPRGRGDGVDVSGLPRSADGSPPRARGRQRAPRPVGRPRRFTPAGAGTATARPSRSG